MQSKFKYTDKQSVHISYKHNFIIHAILILISLTLFIYSFHVKYLNICLGIYCISLIGYFFYAIIHTKIPKLEVHTCMTTWEFTESEGISICFIYNNVIDLHTISLEQLSSVLWCQENRSFLIIYKSSGVFPCLIPLVVNTPMMYASRVISELNTYNPSIVHEITYETMVSMLTEYPEQ